MPGSRLRSLPVFEYIVETRLLALEQHLDESFFRSNEIIYYAGEACNGLYAVLEGAAVVRSEHPGRPVPPGINIGPQEVFGEQEVVAGIDRQLTARAVGPTTLLRIPQQPLRDLLAGHPDLAAHLSGLAVRRRIALARSLFSPVRKEPRIWVDREIVLTLPDGKNVSARLTDLSSSGACLAAVPKRWRAGDQVAFSLGLEDRGPALLRARGTVRWRLGNMVGVSFEVGGPFLRRQVEQVLRTLVPSVA